MREPLHSIIARRAEARILSGAWPPGTRLPPERALCDLLDVSRTSLRLALGDLEERGLITRHQGRGTFVTRPRLDADASSFFSIGAAMRSRGVVVTTRVVEATVVEANERQQQDLGCRPGAPLLRLRRLRFADGEPIVLERSDLPLDLFPGLEQADFTMRSLYDILREDHSVFVATASETLEPVILTAAEGALLAVPRGAPALLFRRTTRDRDERMVEVGEGLLRGDRSRYLIERRVQEGWATRAEPPAGGAAADPADSHAVRIAAGLLSDVPHA